MINFKQNNELYQQRAQRMIDVAEGRVPDRVPIGAFIESYALGYAHLKIADVEGHMLKHVNAFSKIYKDVYWDCAYTAFLTHNLKLGRVLGSDIFFASEDGVTLQHKEFCPMEAEDYKDFIKDPVFWMIDEFLPRKYSKLNSSNEEQKKAFVKALGPFFDYAATMLFGNFYFRKVLGMPTIVGGTTEMPADFFFDFLRGFKNSTIDLRRNPEELKEAIKAITPYTLDLMKITQLLMNAPPKIEEIPWFFDNAINSIILDKEPTYKNFPWFVNPCHFPPFMSDKQFEEFYLDSYVEIATYVKNHGGHLITVLEGEWGEGKLKMLNERVPKNAVTYIAESDDVRLMKKIFGDNASIMGGMPLALLRESTKRECLDYAKALIDDMAPGGGWIFGIDKVLLSPGDVNINNLRAVNEFVHVYGQY